MLYMVAFSKKQLPVSIVVHKMKQEMYSDKIDITNSPWMKNVECGHVNPQGKPDLLAGNVLQQHYNFSLLTLCLHLTIIDCRSSGLSQMQLPKFQ